jgi:glucose-induced degradation protein 8
MYIRQAVESGRVDEAVRRVNELEPEVSESDLGVTFHAYRVSVSG